MTLIIDRYPDSLKSLRAQFDRAGTAFPGTKPVLLARDLVQGAIAMDMDRARNKPVHPAYAAAGIARNPANPPEFEHPSIIGKDYADDPADPLKPGEKWNEGRRATLTGAWYGLDDKGRPVCPYMNFGITGRGLLGLHGPNTAVDNGILILKEDGLYLVGIHRKDSVTKRPALSGGFAKFEKQAGGQFVFDEKADLETRVEEFFEELVSGSVELLPEYAARVDKELNHKISLIEAGRGGKPVSDHERDEQREQVETAVKMQQVRDLDPGFMERLTDFLAQGIECFSGPVLGDQRGTTTAWIESRLSWVMLDDKVWAEIKGDDKFGYELKAGDDADGVHPFKFGPDIVDTAVASHGAMMTFMAASFVLDSQMTGRPVPVVVMNQLRQTADFLNRKYPAPQQNFGPFPGAPRLIP